MSKQAVGRIQRRIHEIGMVGRIAHNLAKYSVGAVNDFTRDEFIAVVREYMDFRGVEPQQVDKWMSLAIAQADKEVEFFITNGRFADSVGGSSIWIGALIGPILDELGYEEVSTHV